ncbi:MAG: Holliday junction resolvase Hjc [Candidatus Micrarchaeaceae archaeon]
MTRYSKGARSERELLGSLHERGYSVMRSAGSGVNTLSPDLIAMKLGKGLAFECKAWDRESIAIENIRFDSLVEWQRNTGMDTYIAWRMNGEGWFFVRLEEMKVAGKSRTVSKRRAVSLNRRLESVIIP